MKKVHAPRGSATADRERVAMLACSDCGTEQPHRVRYRHDAVVEMICTQCERTIVLPRSWGQSAGQPGSTESGATAPSAAGFNAGELGRTDAAGRLQDGRAVRSRRAALPALARSLGVAAIGLSARAATKPWRVWRQVRSEGAAALKTMPRRAATKPMRLARQLRHNVRGLL